eukprot:TRINITY_DN33170_c0_g1_i1.p2 TRINITY_DN33170_c0_g1~~TRINITY_DN33170_c0_g1_i1.p2  ORF type:complete len:222 (+),score=102.12 TRINITY_DN33170_c0_g1_i1:47-712(+)
MASGGGIIGLKYKDGVLMASDVLLAYGGLKKMPGAERHFKIGDHTAVLTTGLYADTQFLIEDLHELEREDNLADDGNQVTTPKSIHAYLRLVMYNKRNDFNPALVTAMVAGKDKGQEPFLGWVDSVGTSSTCDAFAGGIAHYFCMTLLRDATDDGKWKTLTREAAMKLITDCMVVLFTRHTAAFGRIQVTDCTDDGMTTSEPFNLDMYTDRTGVIVNQQFP